MSTPPASGGEPGPAGASGASLLQDVLAWADPWWDEQTGLLWNMEGAFRDLCPPRTVHVIPPSAFYALGLLLRDGPDDRTRADATLRALLAQQYDAPGTAWHGTFARFAEWPAPEGDAVAFEDYDPNWRQFLGTAFALLLDEAEDRIEPSLALDLERAVLVAVAGEPDDRVRASYSNIALMKAWLDVWAGVRSDDVERAAAGEALAGRVVGRFAKSGAFDEYQSPTYYGVDLYALGLWRERSRSALMQEAGLHLEAALWRDLAELHHAGLGTLCGPHDRAYGMDMARYLGAMGLWWWPAFGPGAAPVPDLGTSFDHSHDLLLGVPAATLGPAIPDDAAPALAAFPGEHVVQRGLGRRTVSAWLGEGAMLGGCHGATTAADDQHHPAVGHWRLPDGGLGWLRVLRSGPLDAIATQGRLAVSAPGGPGDVVLRLFVGPEPDLPGADLRSGPEVRARLALPGLDLDVRADAPADDVAVVAALVGDVVEVRWASPTDGLSLLLTFA